MTKLVALGRKTQVWINLINFKSTAHQACALYMHYARGKHVVINEKIMVFPQKKKKVLVLNFFFPLIKTW